MSRSIGLPYEALVAPSVVFAPVQTSLSLEEAVDLLLSRVAAVRESEVVSLLEARGRVSFSDIRARLPQPPFDRAQVDGYALRAADIAGASRENPVLLLVTQRLYAGSGPGLPLQSGEAARVMTGAMLPSGADCVMWQEDTDGGEETVRVSRDLSPHRNCRLSGQDIAVGQMLARRGDILHSGVLGLLAGQGFTHLRVFRRPRVSLLATGDELAPAGAPLPAGGIYNISSTLLGVRLETLGARISRMEICGDQHAGLHRRLADMLAESDMVITTGGVSLGQRDLLPQIAAQLAAEYTGTVLFQGLRIKPGSLTLGMSMPGKVLLGLSGNPVPAAATFELLAVPALGKMAGRAQFRLERQRGVVQNDFGTCRKDSRRLVMARMVGKNVFLHPEGVETRPPGLCDDYNCFVDIPAGSPPLRKGMEVDVILT